MNTSAATSLVGAAVGHVTTLENECPAFATRSSTTRSGRVDGPLAGIGHSVLNIGEHTGEILSELGYDARRIAQLAEQGVLALIKRLLWVRSRSSVGESK